MDRIHERTASLFKKVKSFKLIQYNFYICKYCYERNFKFVKKKIVKYKTLVNIIRSDKKECNICKNLFKKTIYSIIDEIIKSNHFINDSHVKKKIEIGTSLPLQLFEKEDTLKSMFKIKGLPNIKYHYNALIRKEIIKKTGFSIDHLNPDIRIEIFLDNKFNYDIRYKTKELVLLGKYNKYQRGLNQRFKINPMKGEEQNAAQNLYSYPTIPSIEEVILKFLYIQTGSNDIKIAWSGGEDKNSLVLGNGRPFIVKINSPHCRDFQKIFDIKDMLRLNFQEIHNNEICIYDKYKNSNKNFNKSYRRHLRKS